MSHSEQTEYTHCHGGHIHHHHCNPEIKKKQLARISKAIGHLEHVKTMIEMDENPNDVLMQLIAVRSAINGLGKNIIVENMDHCIAHALENGDISAVESFKDSVKKFV